MKYSAGIGDFYKEQRGETDGEMIFQSSEKQRGNLLRHSLQVTSSINKWLPSFFFFFLYKYFFFFILSEGVRVVVGVVVHVYICLMTLIVPLPLQPHSNKS